MRLLPILSAATLAGAALALALSRPGGVSPAALADLAALPADATRGAAVFWAGGCASCHAADSARGDDRLILAGGQRFVTDFGAFRAPNISPDPAQGLGAWGLEDFADAMRHGVGPDGRHYYPAFPYTAYRRMTDRDLTDLWAFMATLPPSPVPSEAHEIAFPFSIRRAVGLWNLIYLRDDFAVPGPLAPEAARGRYLAEALAHCGECHTPRDGLGGLRRDRWLAGAPVIGGSGTVPALTPGALTWSERDIAAYLEDGFTPEFDSAGGHMASVIENLSMLDDADRLAIAAYLKGL